MTASREELVNWLRDGSPSALTCLEAADLIEQQAKTIADLEHENGRVEHDYASTCDENGWQRARIHTLEDALRLADTLAWFVMSDTECHFLGTLAAEQRYREARQALSPPVKSDEAGAADGDRPSGKWCGPRVTTAGAEMPTGGTLSAETRLAEKEGAHDNRGAPENRGTATPAEVPMAGEGPARAASSDSTQRKEGDAHDDDAEQARNASDVSAAPRHATQPAEVKSAGVLKHVCGAADYFYAVYEKGLPECPACVANWERDESAAREGSGGHGATSDEASRSGSSSTATAPSPAEPSAEAKKLARGWRQFLINDCRDIELARDFDAFAAKVVREAVREANRRDRKWMDGIIATCGRTINFDALSPRADMPTLDEFINGLTRERDALKARNAEMKSGNLQSEDAEIICPNCGINVYQWVAGSED